MKQLLYVVILLTCTSAFAQKDKKLTDQTVSRLSIQAHLKFLSSDALEGRDTPSKGLEVAAEYLRTQLEYYGVKPLPQYPDYFQPVAMKKVIKPKQGTIRVDTVTYDIGEDFLMITGEDVSWKGEFIFLDHATPDEIARADVKGKVIVANTGDGTEQSPRAWFGMIKEKRTAAREAGAVALIELFNSAQLPWPLLVRYLSGDQVALDTEEQETFPYLWMTDANRVASPVFEKASELSLEMKGSAIEPFEVHNIVGYVEGTDPALKSQYVAYSAHYDHVGIGTPDSTGDAIYNGTRDNAIGTVTVLEAAKNYALYPTKRSSLFILFAGEEKGLLGSEWYVEHSPVPLSDIVYCFNSDGAGYNNTSIATIIGLHRTTADPQIIEALETYNLRASDDSKYADQGLFDRSDNVSFAKKGIPAPTFSLGIEEFDAEIFKRYHQPADEFDSVDMNYMFNFYRAYVLAGRLIGNMKETPFWVEGDKYYEAGKELYGSK